MTTITTADRDLMRAEPKEPCECGWPVERGTDRHYHVTIYRSHTGSHSVRVWWLWLAQIGWMTSPCGTARYFGDDGQKATKAAERAWERYGATCLIDYRDGRKVRT